VHAACDACARLTTSTRLRHVLVRRALGAQGLKSASIAALVEARGLVPADHLKDLFVDRFRCAGVGSRFVSTLIVSALIVSVIVCVFHRWLSCRWHRTLFLDVAGVIRSKQHAAMRKLLEDSTSYEVRALFPLVSTRSTYFCRCLSPFYVALPPLPVPPCFHPGYRCLLLPIPCGQGRIRTLNRQVRPDEEKSCTVQ
jgi:hypothetical protein